MKFLEDFNKIYIYIYISKSGAANYNNNDDSFQLCDTDNGLEGLYNLEQLGNRECKEEIYNLYETKK